MQPLSDSGFQICDFHLTVEAYVTSWEFFLILEPLPGHDYNPYYDGSSHRLICNPLTADRLKAGLFLPIYDSSDLLRILKANKLQT